MSVTETRYKNARMLVAQAGGVVAFSEKLAMSKSQASHIVGANPIKGIGHGIARRIEKAFKLQTGWLDEPHDGGTARAAVLGKEQVRMLFSEELSKRMGVPDSARYVIMPDDSMSPTLEQGSILVTDRGSALSGDGVYLLNRGGERFVRRVQRDLGGKKVTLKCDNTRYDDVTIESLDRAGLSVSGRILLAWAPRRM